MLSGIMDLTYATKKRRISPTPNFSSDDYLEDGGEIDDVTASIHKNKRTTLERIEKYISTTYFADVNLTSKLYPEKNPVAIFKWTKSLGEGEWTKWNFQDIVKQTFEPVSVGHVFSPTWSTHWFKVLITIPGEWKGKYVVFRWKSQSEAMIWSKDGEPLQGLSTGISHQMRSEYTITKELIVDEDGKSPEIVLYIEVACNNMFGAGLNGLIEPPDSEKRFNLEAAEICIMDTEVKRLILDLEVLHDMAKHMKEEHQGYKALYAANSMINYIIKGDHEKACGISTEFFSNCTGGVRHTLALMGHCHIDSAWLWPYSESKRKCARSWASVLDLLDKYPEMHFTCSQAQQFEWVKEHYPSLYSRIKKKVESGSFIPVGGTWVEMDGLLPSGESFVRQFLYGQKFFEEEFGIKCSEFWLPDTFGYSAQFPQICKHFGIERFLTQKLSWSLVNKFPHHNFIWEGLDGSRILAHFPPGDSYEMNVTVEEALKTVNNLQDKGRVRTSAFLYGHGDGGGGPTQDMLERARRLHDVQGLPKMAHITPNDFFSILETQKRNLCRWVGELFLELHNGTYTSQANTKKQNRKCEFALRTAEMLLAMVHINFLEDLEIVEQHKKNVDAAWKKLLLNQFHDVLPGSSIEIVYRDSDILYKEVMLTTQKVTSDCLSKLQSRDDKTVESTEDLKTVYMLNTLPWPVQVCELSSEGSVCYEVPSMGVHAAKQIDFIPEVESSCYNNRIILSNKYLEAEITNYGQVVKLEPRGRPNFSGSKRIGIGNVLTLYDDIPLFWDAWDTMDYHLETATELNSKMNNTITPMKLIVKTANHVKYEWSLKNEDIGIELTQYISLTSTDKYLKFETKVDWKANRKSLKVAFHTNLLSRTAKFDTQFGFLERTTHNNTSWDAAQYEVCGHKWASLSEHDLGIAVLNDCKYGWHVKDGSIVLSLLRSPKSPDKNCDMGLHEFTFAVMLHDGDIQSSKVIEASYNLNNPPQKLSLVDYPRGFDIHKWISIVDSEGGVMIEAVKLPYKLTEEHCLIVRLSEIYGGSRAIRVAMTDYVRYVQECDGLENDCDTNPISLDGLPYPRYATIKFRPFELKTLKLYC